MSSRSSRQLCAWSCDGGGKLEFMEMKYEVVERRRAICNGNEVQCGTQFPYQWLWRRAYEYFITLPPPAWPAAAAAGWLSLTSSSSDRSPAALTSLPASGRETRRGDLVSSLFPSSSSSVASYLFCPTPPPHPPGCDKR